MRLFLALLAAAAVAAVEVRQVSIGDVEIVPEKSLVSSADEEPAKAVDVRKRVVYEDGTVEEFVASGWTLVNKYKGTPPVDGVQITYETFVHGAGVHHLTKPIPAAEEEEEEVPEEGESEENKDAATDLPDVVIVDDEEAPIPVEEVVVESMEDDKAAETTDAAEEEEEEQEEQATTAADAEPVLSAEGPVEPGQEENMLVLPPAGHKPEVVMVEQNDDDVYTEYQPGSRFMREIVAQNGETLIEVVIVADTKNPHAPQPRRFCEDGWVYEQIAEPFYEHIEVMPEEKQCSSVMQVVKRQTREFRQPAPVIAPSRCRNRAPCGTRGRPPCPPTRPEDIAATDVPARRRGPPCKNRRYRPSPADKQQPSDDMRLYSPFAPRDSVYTDPHTDDQLTKKARRDASYFDNLLRQKRQVRL